MSLDRLMLWIVICAAGLTLVALMAGYVLAVLVMPWWLTAITGGGLGLVLYIAGQFGYNDQVVLVLEVIVDLLPLFAAVLSTAGITKLVHMLSRWLGVAISFADFESA